MLGFYFCVFSHCVFSSSLS
uniref:Uncharacterized protein n=1 Tax=Anguilla anguilla TaxID=7936 RepID=A0A0E9P7D0_ANGAN